MRTDEKCRKYSKITRTREWVIRESCLRGTGPFSFARRPLALQELANVCDAPDTPANSLADEVDPLGWK